MTKAWWPKDSKGLQLLMWCPSHTVCQHHLKMTARPVCYSHRNEEEGEEIEDYIGSSHLRLMQCCSENDVCQGDLLLDHYDM